MWHARLQGSLAASSDLSFGARLIMYAQFGRIRHDNLALRPLAGMRTASGRTCPVVPT
jgi:hypothetical protein